MPFTTNEIGVLRAEHPRISASVREELFVVVIKEVALPSSVTVVGMGFSLED